MFAPHFQVWRLKGDFYSMVGVLIDDTLKVLAGNELDCFLKQCIPS